MTSKDRTHPNVTLAVLSLGAIAYAMLSSTVIPALPTLQRDLHTTETGIAWLLTAYLLAASVGTPILGRLGDMYGKERLLLWTLLILVVGTVMAALSSSLGVLIVARFIQGAAGGIFPLAFGIVRDEFPREKVAGGIGLLSAILGVGGGAGIVLSGVIIEHLSYHWLFWIPLVPVVIAAVATWRFVPESPIRVPGRVNWLAAVLMTIGISAALLAISETTTWGWGSPKTLLLLLVGFIFIFLWILVEVRSDHPLVDMTMMRVRGVWTTNASAFLLGAGLYASFVVFPQFAQLPTSTGFGFGASVVVSGLYLLPTTVGMTILGLKAGAISARFGSRAALLGGHAVLHRVVRDAGRRPRASLGAAGRRRAARRGHRPRLRGAGQPHRAGGAQPSDGRGERHEHGDENTRRRAGRPALGHLHRQQHVARRTHRHRLHPDLLDGHRLPPRVPRGRGSRAKARLAASGPGAQPRRPSWSPSAFSLWIPTSPPAGGAVGMTARRVASRP